MAEGINGGEVEVGARETKCRGKRGRGREGGREKELDVKSEMRFQVDRVLASRADAFNDFLMLLPKRMNVS